MRKLRKAAVAGLFYPAEPTNLSEEVKLLLSVSQPEKNFKNILGIVSPHAGYIYSGRTAAYGFNLLKNKNYHNVIILSPSHKEYFPGISIYDGDAYSTPLGTVEVNKDLANKLIEGSKTIFLGEQGHRQEHAIEVQLPFLQTVLNDFQIVPIVIGDQSKLFVDELAKQLAKVIDENTVVVASSDMSHYHSRQQADVLDSIVENAINNFEYDKLQDYLDKRVCEACGGGPIVATMKAADLLNRENSFVLNRSDSGDVTGDFNEVVGYLSAVVYGD
ncbi:MAG: AmmeMemoRadiSam system protein B [Ignavibacteriaceae bacterium]